MRAESGVAIIGFGTIGRSVAHAIWDGTAGDTVLRAVLVRNPATIDASALKAHGTRLVTDLTEVLREDVDLVVEAGGHAALRASAEQVLGAGKDLMTVSVGAFADEAFRQRVEEVAKRTGCQVLVPSGAIAGLDAIGAAALAPIEEVIHTTRKHPRAFTAAQLSGPEPAEARLLFDGAASDGVQRFPENVNVAAAVSLAGIGLARTRLRVYADPAVQRNTHVVEVRGAFGKLRIEMENIPTENPKTGRIVALSIAKALRNRRGPFVVGV